MEKYARQAINDGVTSTEELSITRDCELYRALNMHYNKANDFEVRTDLSVSPLLLILLVQVEIFFCFVFTKMHFHLSQQRTSLCAITVMSLAVLLVSLLVTTEDCLNK